jgi:hypothetical protein
VRDDRFPIARFAAGTLGFLDQNRSTVVIDLRNNDGGDSAPCSLIEARRAKPRLSVLIGRDVLSRCSTRCSSTSRRARC